MLKVPLDAIKTLYPPALADSAWDNTGLLLQAPGENKNKRVMLCIDLTTAVCGEAIERGANLVVAYHPIIFRPIKSLTLKDSQQKSLLELAQHGISVYCPHTAVDAVENGLNHWLAAAVGKSASQNVIQPCGTVVEGHANAGYGLITRLQSPSTIMDIVTAVKTYLGVEHGKV